MRFTKWILFVSLLCVVSYAAAVETVKLTILHTNDTHGHLLPFSYPNIVQYGSDEAQLSDRSDIGGIARRATLAKQIKADVKAKGGTAWLIDCGDVNDGTPFSTEYHGIADVEAMNAAGYDFATYGNHEFNNSLETVLKIAQTAKYPILSANSILRNTGKTVAQSYVIQKVGKLRVGIFGLTTKDAATYPAGKEGIDVLEEVGTAQKTVAELKAKVDVIILISHCGYDVDKKIAKSVPGIDVIVGGHSHSRLPSGDFVWRNEEMLPETVNGTIIAQAYQWGGELGRLDLLFAKSGKKWNLSRYKAELILINDKIAPDPSVEKVVNQYWDPIKAQYAEVIGTASNDFSSRGDDNAEYNLVADAVRETFGAEFGMENFGGVRAPLVKGPITSNDVVTMDPFNNTVIKFKIKGAVLKTILEKHKPAVSGIRYRIEDNHLTFSEINGKPIDDNQEYEGVTNSYFANYILPPLNITGIDTKAGRRQTVIDYIKAKKIVNPMYDSRRVLINTQTSY